MIVNDKQCKLFLKLACNYTELGQNYNSRMAKNVALGFLYEVRIYLARQYDVKSVITFKKYIKCNTLLHRSNL